MLKILVCDPIHKDGLQILSNSGIQIDLDIRITPEQLLDKVSAYDALMIRSRTKITRDVLNAAVNLKAIGRAGVGLDNVDKETWDNGLSEHFINFEKVSLNDVNRSCSYRRY